MERGRPVTDLEKALIDGFQRYLPLVPRPFAAMAEKLGVTENDVIDALSALHGDGVVSRVGAVVAPHSLGWSTLAAMAVPEDRVEEVARVINGFAGVNHNYEREHRLNVWFVVTGPDREAVGGILAAIERRTGLAVLDLPMEQSFHIDLGFRVQWN